MKSEVITFKASDHFRHHLQKQAEKKDLKLGTYIKAMLKKYSGYKEKELV